MGQTKRQHKAQAGIEALREAAIPDLKLPASDFNAKLLDVM